MDASSLSSSLTELKEDLRKKSKEGRALSVSDAKGRTVYEWEQSKEYALLYLPWPFPSFDYDDPETKFKCTIASDTVLIKGKNGNNLESKSLRFTTGGLVNVLYSKHSVVYKGNTRVTNKKRFAIEIALCKRKAGDQWPTALKAKHIGTNHMSSEDIKEELQESYGIDTTVFKTKEELLRALRLARSKGNSVFSAMSPSMKKRNTHAPEAAARRSRSADADMSLSPVRNRKTTRMAPSRARSFDMCKSLVDDDWSDTTSTNTTTKKSDGRFVANQVVYYTSNGGRQQEKAKIIKIHLDDELVPFYDIKLEESGKEKQTDDAHLSSLTDDMFKAAAAAATTKPAQQQRGRSNSVDNDDCLFEPRPKGRSRSRSFDRSNPNPIPNGQLLRGKKKKPKQRARSMDMNESLVDATDLPPKPTKSSRGAPPQRKAPGRSRSMDMGDSLVSDEDNDFSSRSQVAKGVPKRSRFMENQVVYYISNNGQKKEKAKILKIHLDDELVPFYDIRIEEGGKEKQTDDGHLASLTDGLFQSALLSATSTPGKQRGVQRRASMDSDLLGGMTLSATKTSSSSMRSRSEDFDSPGTLSKRNKKPVQRRRSLDASTSLVGDFALSDSIASSSSSRKKGSHRSRFTENQVVYYTSNEGVREKARITSIHLDDELVPFYDILLDESGKEKQTDDAHLSSLTDDLFKSAMNPSSSTSLSLNDATTANEENRDTSPHPSRVKAELKSYGLDPESYSYVTKEEPMAAWKIIRSDSRKPASKLKEELVQLDVDPTSFMEKKELVSALCRAKLARRRERRERNVERTNSDGPMRNKPKMQRRFSDGPLSSQKARRRAGAVN